MGDMVKEDMDIDPNHNLLNNDLIQAAASSVDLPSQETNNVVDNSNHNLLNNDLIQAAGSSVDLQGQETNNVVDNSPIVTESTETKTNDKDDPKLDSEHGMLDTKIRTEGSDEDSAS